MRKKNLIFLNIVLFFLILLNSCSKGPIVRDIVKGIYDKSDKNKSINSKKIKIFIQVNIGDEKQKSGVNKSSVNELYSYCKAINLNVIGLMCIPPLTKSSDIYFKEMNILNKNLNLNELSMGMSSDYLDAIKNSATYVRIGSNIFGQRS